MIASAGVLVAVGGVILVWAAITDQSPADIVRDAIQGRDSGLTAEEQEQRQRLEDAGGTVIIR